MTKGNDENLTAVCHLLCYYATKSKAAIAPTPSAANLPHTTILPSALSKGSDLFDENKSLIMFQYLI